MWCFVATFFFLWPFRKTRRSSFVLEEQVGSGRWVILRVTMVHTQKFAQRSVVLGHGTRNLPVLDGSRDVLWSNRITWLLFVCCNSSWKNIIKIMKKMLRWKRRTKECCKLSRFARTVQISSMSRDFPAMTPLWTITHRIRSTIWLVERFQSYASPEHFLVLINRTRSSEATDSVSGEFLVHKISINTKLLFGCSFTITRMVPGSPKGLGDVLSCNNSLFANDCVHKTITQQNNSRD